MGEEPKYKKVLLKLSGDFFSGENKALSCNSCQFIAREIGKVYSLGIKMGVVVGGGNIVRGAALSPGGVDRFTADYMGMLATVINGLVLKNYLIHSRVPATLYSALEVKGVVPLFSLEKVKKDLEEGKVVILSGGTGNPYFTTDTAAALRAVEIGAEVLLKGTKVDGIYERDPLQFPGSAKLPRLTFREAITLGVKVMDLSALTMCQENRIPVVVFKMDEPGNLTRVLQGEMIGSIVQED